MLSLHPPRQPDYRQFLRALARRQRPTHLPFYEHLATGSFIASATGKPFGAPGQDAKSYWSTYVEFWVNMGFDVVPMEILLNSPLHNTDGSAHSHGSEDRSLIHNMAEFEKYPWATPAAPIDFKPFEMVAGLLPEGVKIVGGVCMGPYEWVSSLMGTQGLCFALVDQPELVEAMFTRIGELIVAADRQLATMDAICALRQGDDLGFKTSTFLSPADLRRFVFPTYKKMVEAAHGGGKPFILHSCGNLGEVYEDLITDVGIDAKHSFEDTILPVDQFKAKYGRRITPLGGIDVDMVCRADEPVLRRYIREKIERCFADGFYALGTGNSLTDYMPVDRYRIVLDEGMKAAQ
jgi:uroporphyrinogen decarboxylase